MWLCACLIPASGYAQPWSFTPPIDLTPPPQAGVFHHLDSPGRQHVAVSGDRLAIVWEDNSSGQPAAYVVTRPVSREGFDPPVKVSGPADAYEPSILAVGADAFLISWEESEAVWVRTFRARTGGAPVKLAERATQVSLTMDAVGTPHAFWAERDEGSMRVRGAALRLSSDRPQVGERVWIDTVPCRGDQAYPVAAFHESLDAFVVVWEDRRYHNTVLLSAIGTFARRFSIPMQVNALVTPLSGRYGRGSGVARGVVTAHDGGVVAAWADKRKFEFGYDIYAATARHSGRFGENVLVQDGFAEGYEQWHPAIASNGAHLAVAWDDDRDGSSDIWLAWYESNAWSDDLNVPGASQSAEESHPSLTIDPAGNIHLVWIARATEDAPSRIRYLFGRPDH